MRLEILCVSSVIWREVSCVWMLPKMGQHLLLGQLIHVSELWKLTNLDYDNILTLYIEHEFH